MMDRTDLISNKMPKPEASLEQLEQARKRNRQGADDNRTAKADKVSLDQSQAAEQTYGPIPGVAVGTPYEMLRSLVIKTLQEQGTALQIDTGSEILDLQTMSPEQAQELIAEDGYFGVEQTSQRIVDFAINAFGNDPAKLEEMKAAIEDGFQQAADVFGGSLPEISHQTYEAIMEKLDSFAQGETDQETA
jgi:hypothetical protein